MCCVDQYKELRGVGWVSSWRSEWPGNKAWTPSCRLDLYRSHSSRHFHRDGQALPRKHQLTFSERGRMYNGRRTADATSQRLSSVAWWTLWLQICHRRRNRSILFTHLRSLLGARMRVCFTDVFVFCFFLFFFRPPQKYQTTVLGNGWTDFHGTFTKR